MATRESGQQGSGDLWTERLRALEGLFGKADDGVLHRIMGEGAAVVSFSTFRGVKLYVTAELTGSGQKPNSCGQYELAIAHTSDERWGAGFLPEVAASTMEEVFDHGHTMDLASYAPAGSAIRAVLFQRIGQFRLSGEPANVLLMIGITQEELDYKSAAGADALLEEMPMDYIVTDLNRQSFVRSWFRRLWDGVRG